MAFPTNCNGRIINVDASTGCTLTRASIYGMTPNDFEAQGYKEVGMDKYYATLREARLAGYRENTLQALLMSRVTNIKPQLTKTQIPNSPSVILPYISRRQKRVIQSNYWKVVSGTPNAQAGKGSTPASAWDVVVTNTGSPYANTLTNLEQYFLPGKVMFIEYANSSTHVAYQLQYKILGAKTVGTTTTVTLEPNYSAAGWAALAAASKLPYQIGGVSGGNAVSGTIAYLGPNSVSDYESWGGQDNAENTNSLIHFWPQTSRIVHEYTDEYLKALNAALTSNYLKEFVQLPLAEQKRIQRAKYDRDMLNGAFYGQKINEFQTVENYRSLPKVVDPSNPDCVLEFKCNALGFDTQLSDCSRSTDHAGAAINMETWLAKLYLLKRAREVEGNVVDTIDVMTDRFTAGFIFDWFMAFYKAKYGVVNNRNYSAGQELKFENQVELTYNTYQLPPELGGFNLAVFAHPFFEDKLTAMAYAAGQTSATNAAADRGRALWALDWSDIELGMGGTNSVVRRTNEADELYQYVMKINVKHVTMESTKWCPIIEDPNRHSIEKNFDATCPTGITVSGCTVTAG